MFIVTLAEELLVMLASGKMTTEVEMKDFIVPHLSIMLNYHISNSMTRAVGRRGPDNRAEIIHESSYISQK